MTAIKAGGVSRSRPSKQDVIAQIAETLSHLARVRIVEMLVRRRTCVGCDIVDEIEPAASTTSEHLRILKEAGLIVGEIERPRVCYSLDPAAMAPLHAFVNAVLDRKAVAYLTRTRD